jgi:hypothetical protein
MTEEKDLQMEGPLPHVGVEISKIGVVGNRLKGCAPTKAGADTLGEGCLPGCNIPGDEDKAFGHGHLLGSRRRRL